MENNSIKNLSKNFDQHEYPKILLKNPFLIKIIYIIENITRLRNWYINRSISKELEGKLEKFKYLDFGCGTGVFSIPLTEKYKNSNFVCLDKNSHNINMLEKVVETGKIKNVRCTTGELSSLSEEKFDYITCASVLQYIEDDEKLLREFYKHLNLDGCLFLYIPINEKRIFKLFSKLSNGYFKNQNYNHSNYVFQKYSLELVIEKLKNASFSISEAKESYGFWGKLYYEIFASFEMVLKKVPLIFSLLIMVLMLLTFPALLVFMFLDYYLNTKNGNGVIIIAKK